MRKQELIEWCKHNMEWLGNHKLYATGTTGKLIEDIDAVWRPVHGELYVEKKGPMLDKVNCLLSGHLGGDQQIGSRMVDGEIDYLFFFTDPMSMQPHDTDIKALTRLASVQNIIFCCNRATADHIISSPLFQDSTYSHKPLDFTAYSKRFEGRDIAAEAVKEEMLGK